MGIACCTVGCELRRPLLLRRQRRMGRKLGSNGRLRELDCSMLGSVLERACSFCQPELAAGYFAVAFAGQAS